MNKPFPHIFRASTLLRGVLLLGATAAIHAAPVNYEEAPMMFTKTRATDWNRARDWSTGQVPDGFVRAYVCAGDTLTIRGKADNTVKLSLGTRGEKLATIRIEDGAKAKFSVITIGAGWQVNSTAEGYLTGGELIMQNPTNSGFLLIADAATHSGTGRFEISGGKFAGGIIVGGIHPNTQVGTLVIKGSKANISANSPNTNKLDFRPSGTLIFELDDEGVSTLNWKGNTAIFAPQSLIRIDGKAYKGPPKTLTLVEADTIKSKDAKIEVVNFPSQYDAKAAFTTRGDKKAILQLKISRAN